MFNPFYPFTRQLLQAFVDKGKRYFVRQSFERGRSLADTGIKECFLITHYEALTTALDHYGAIAHDGRRFLYDWNREDHQQRLVTAASAPEGYRVFAAVLRPDYDKAVDRLFQKKLRLYIDRLGWQPKRDEGVTSNYELQFGELYIRLKYRGREAKIKFEEIENIS